MDKATFTWKEYGGSVIICKAIHGKVYGKVCRNGKIYWRNYGREMKNGKGLSIIDRMRENIFQTNEEADF